MPVDLSPRLEVPDVSIETPSTAIERTVDPAFEERWTAWCVRGHRHEVAVRRRLRIVALAVVIVVVLVVLGIRLLEGSL
jgi:hypothetical protein